MNVLVPQWCLMLCNPMDCSLTGFSVHGLLQSGILEWAAMPSSRGIFPSQGSNPGLLCCRQIPYRLSHQGSPRSPKATVVRLRTSGESVWRRRCQDRLAGPRGGKAAAGSTFCDPMDCKTPGSIEFSRQEYWSGLPFLFPHPMLKKKIKIWLCHVLVAACEIFSCDMWDLIP